MYRLDYNFKRHPAPTMFESHTDELIAEALEYRLCDCTGKRREEQVTMDLDLGDGRSAHLEATLYTDGYCEDDYIYGTGAFVCTEASLNIYRIEVYNEDDEEIDADVNIWDIEKYVEDKLVA